MRDEFKQILTAIVTLLVNYKIKASDFRIVLEIGDKIAAIKDIRKLMVNVNVLAAVNLIEKLGGNIVWDNVSPYGSLKEAKDIIELSRAYCAARSKDELIHQLIGYGVLIEDVKKVEETKEMPDSRQYVFQKVCKNCLRIYDWQYISKEVYENGVDNPALRVINDRTLEIVSYCGCHKAL